MYQLIINLRATLEILARDWAIMKESNSTKRGFN
ncbi:hypothetical protein ACFDR9_000964 [Janthinobacterium sp. CG_23.3]